MTVTDIAVVGVAQSASVRRSRLSEAQILVPTIAAAIEQAGIDRREVGFTCSGSCDYLTGGPFAFVSNLEAAGAWPPIAESHVEADGAFALYEAWVRLQEGDIDVALAFGSGKSSPSQPSEVWAQQLDPYFLAPLGLDPPSLAGLQARAVLDAGLATERDFAEVVARSRRNAAGNPHAQLRTPVDVEALLSQPYVRDPLRRHDLPPISDGAAAVVLARGDRARQLCERPAWIKGFDHRVEEHLPGLRDLTRSASTSLAAAKAGYDGGPLDVAEVSATFSPQEGILVRALGLDGDVAVNPSGGPLAANPVMAVGLVRIIEAATRIMDGQAQRALAHVTAGPLLQQNLVCYMEGEQ
ncbi:lipid-transfer protein [Acidiferrimicrobium sp. IK]|uniref:lipid-transfer protein n=1 Tax=Acidiferrimicrobium sp. IK TaxID=2871700 RepID=UPI0021CB4B14|nr:lipid-transfer protein [Acidiferrimicrobium sp. IK]MCU4184176.1 lipid-transfer protein [Acidiferrimicrobium sp. IK]